MLAIIIVMHLNKNIFTLMNDIFDDKGSKYSISQNVT